MNTLLAKFRISLALDEQATNGSQRTAPPDEPAEVRRLRESMQALETRLKAARPAAAVPAGLHDSIMQTVRAKARTQERRPRRMRMRWLPAPALALLALFAVLWSLLHPAAGPKTPPQPAGAHPTAEAANALNQGYAMAEKAPAAMLAPLSDEMDSLKRDFHSALDFVVASMP